MKEPSAAFILQYPTTTGKACGLGVKREAGRSGKSRSNDSVIQAAGRIVLMMFYMFAKLNNWIHGTGLSRVLIVQIWHLYQHWSQSDAK
jgi:hypothetical protein